MFQYKQAAEVAQCSGHLGTSPWWLWCCLEQQRRSSRSLFIRSPLILLLLRGLGAALTGAGRIAAPRLVMGLWESSFSGIYSDWEIGAASSVRRGVGRGPSAGHMAEDGNKLTLRRLEAPVHKFIKVALPTDLERLQKHHSNVLKVKRDLPHVSFWSGDG